MTGANSLGANSLGANSLGADSLGADSLGATEWPRGWLVDWRDAVGSTMDEARLLAAAGAPHGTVVAAHVQHAGRGRLGRAWVSPAGNLHMTAVLRPGVELRRTPELGFVVGLAVAEAVDELAGPPTGLKWPNDVLRQGAKLAGVLLERLDDGAVLAGIGLNVRHCPAGLPYPVTSLAAEGLDLAVAPVLDAVLRRLRAGWSAWREAGLAGVLLRWAERAPPLGTALRVGLPGGVVCGRFAGLGADGSLLLDTAQGRRALAAGDVLL